MSIWWCYRSDNQGDMFRVHTVTKRFHPSGPQSEQYNILEKSLEVGIFDRVCVPEVNAGQHRRPFVAHMWFAVLRRCIS
jgi:hypothetical protein